MDETIEKIDPNFSVKEIPTHFFLPTVLFNRIAQKEIPPASIPWKVVR